MSKKCPSCGHDTSESDKFCPYCGANLTGDLNNGGYQFDAEDTSRQSAGYDSDIESAKGIGSLILGIMSIIIPYANIIFGIVAIALSTGLFKKNKFAKAGRILGVIGIVISVLEIVFTIIYFTMIIHSFY